MLGQLLGGNAASVSESAAEQGVQLVTEYADLKVPVINIIMEGLTLILFIAALVVAAVWIFNHVRNFALPFVCGIVFYLVFVYVLVQLVVLGLNFLLSKNEALTAHVTLLENLVQVLSMLCGVASMVLGMLYWRRSSRKNGSEMTLGGAIAFGAAFYAGILLTSGNLSRIFQMITTSRAVNADGFDAVLTAMVEIQGDQQGATEALLALCSDKTIDFVNLPLNALIVILEGVTYTAASVIFFAALTDRVDRKYMIASIAAHLLVFAPSVLLFFTEDTYPLFYIRIAYTALVALASVLLAVYLSKTYMADEVHALAYTRKKQKQEEEAKKNKIPHIVMPKD